MPELNILRNEKDIRTYSSGETIFNEGDPGDVMYGIIEGEVEIIKNDRVLDKLTVGEIMGEMALIDDSPRSAAAVAVTDCRLAAIDRSRFSYLIQGHPYFSLQVMSVMAERLRRKMEV